MFFTVLDLQSLQAAAARCGLLTEKRNFFHLNRFDGACGEEPFPKSAMTPEGKVKSCELAFSPPGATQLWHKNKCHEVGVLSHPDGFWIAVWDPHRGGFGLCTHIGGKGEHLRTAYFMEAVEGVRQKFADVYLSSSCKILAEGGVTITWNTGEDSMAKIIVDIDKKGDATFKVEGAPGPSCTELTKAVQTALGAMVQETYTEEYHHVDEQHVSQSLGG